MEETQTDKRTVLLSWETLSFLPLERGPRWYAVAGTIMALVLLYALFSGSFTMALAFIMVGVVFYLSHRQKPRLLNVQITDMGITYDGEFYSYHMIGAFFIIYHPPYVHSLYLKLGGKHPRLLKIELAHQDPVPLRNLLLKEIPEIEGATEPFFDTLSRILRLSI